MQNIEMYVSIKQPENHLQNSVVQYMNLHRSILLAEIVMD